MSDYKDVPAEPEDVGAPAPSKADYYSYQFDTWYTSDPNAQVICLIIANILCIIVLNFLFGITGSLASTSGFDFFAELTWMSWGQLSGTGGSPDGGLWGTRFAGVVCAFMGMFVFSLICAFIEEAINAKLEGLRKGKSRVLESSFSLVIGWSDRVLPLLNQLTLANESDGGGVIVILAEKDKEWMDGYLQDNLEDRRGSSVITRSGSPIDLFSLRKVNATEARSITVLAVHADPDESDAQTTRTVLALTGALGGIAGHEDKDSKVYEGDSCRPGRKEEGIKGHIVCELCDVDNAEIVRLGIQDVGQAKAMVKPVIANDLTGRLMIQCALEPGLARVFTHILAFDFNEFYFKEWPILVGRRFADVCFIFRDAVPFGIHLKVPLNDEWQTRILVNPPGDQIIQDGDEIIVIAEDDGSYFPGELNMVDPGPTPDVDEQGDLPMRIMLIGFRRDLDDMIAETDKWVQPESVLLLFCDKEVDERNKILEAGGLKPDELENVSLEHFVGNPMLLKNIEMVNPSSFNAIIVLTEKSEERDGLSCDSRTLVTTLLIRDIQKQEGVTDCCLVSEILDPRTEVLVKLAKMNDFICANDFVSMALGQMSEESDIHGLIEDLFSPEGSEMHIKNIELYAYENEELNFWELVTRARNRAEVCLGWIKLDEYEGGAGVPCLNPPDKFERYYWQQGDQLVVLAED